MMKHRRLARAALSCVPFLFVAACGPQTGGTGDAGRESIPKKLLEQTGPFALEAGQNEIKIAAYNVENLFDVEHDVENGKDKEDYTFLPKGYPGKAEYCRSVSVPAFKHECQNTDWTQDKLNIKLAKIAYALSRQGSAPDVLAVEEIENLNVARQLAAAVGYTHVEISTSPDVRGIDNALFYKTEKLRFLARDEIVLRGGAFDTGPTRNILRVKFAVVGGRDGDVIEVFVNHWPSQASKPAKRLAVARALMQAIEAETLSVGAEHYYPIALGDFNTLEDERPNAFDDVVEAGRFALWDAEKASYAGNNPLRAIMPEHSYYYDRDHVWSKLDRIVLGQAWDRDGHGALSARVETFRYIADPNLLERRRDGTMGPKGFDATFLERKTAASQGYTDHLQVAMLLRVR